MPFVVIFLPYFDLTEKSRENRRSSSQSASFCHQFMPAHKTASNFRVVHIIGGKRVAIHFLEAGGRRTK